MGNPLISVVTAAYNARDALEFTVASVKHQTLACEHIVVDGGSNDGTANFLASQGVKFVSEPDQGIADAMNKGIAMATGKYVIILHAGDVFLDVDSAAHAVRFFNQDLVSFSVLTDSGIIDAGPYSLKTRFFSTVPHQGLFVRRSVFDDLGGFDESFSISMDYEWVTRAAKSDKIMRWVQRPIAIMAPGGVSGKRDWPTLARRLRENRRIHFMHSTHPIEDWIFRAFWLAYLPFKFLRR